MPRLIVDASVALAWALPDEISSYAERALETAERDGLRVPELWAFELANGLTVAYRRKRITMVDTDLFVAALSRLDIAVQTIPIITAIRKATDAAIKYGLTGYDAAYVDLAMREGLALATSDAAMRKAAEQQGIAVFR